MHILVRFFFVKDIILDRKIKLEHCPTLNMVGNYFTKTLQGKQFYKFRKLIINLDEEKNYYALKPADYLEMYGTTA